MVVTCMDDFLPGKLPHVLVVPGHTIRSVGSDGYGQRASPCRATFFLAAILLASRVLSSENLGAVFCSAVFCARVDAAFFAAHLAFSASTMRLRPAALSFRFFRAFGAGACPRGSDVASRVGGLPGPRLPLIPRMAAMCPFTRESFASSPTSAASSIAGSRLVINHILTSLF